MGKHLEVSGSGMGERVITLSGFKPFQGLLLRLGGLGGIKGKCSNKHFSEWPHGLNIYKFESSWYSIKPWMVSPSSSTIKPG